MTKKKRGGRAEGTPQEDGGGDGEEGDGEEEEKNAEHKDLPVKMLEIQDVVNTKKNSFLSRAKTRFIFMF